MFGFLKKIGRQTSIGLREVLDSLDESCLREIAKINKVADPNGGLDVVRAELLSMAKAQPVVMFALIGAFSERIWAKIKAALEGTQQELLPDDWTCDVDAESAAKMFSLFQFFFLAVSFTRIEGPKCPVRVTATTEALEYWRNGGAKVILKLREYHNRCFQLAQAAANLYGIVDIEDFADICRYYLGDDVGGMDAPEVMGIQLELRSRFEGGNFRVVNDEIQHCDLHDEEQKIKILREAHKRVEPWVPEKFDDFIRFVDTDAFLRIPAFAECDALVSQDGRDAFDDKLLWSIELGWREGCGDDKILRLSAFLMAKTLDVSHEIVVRVLSDLRNTARTWEYFGNTAVELDCCKQVSCQSQMPLDVAAELRRNPLLPEQMTEYCVSSADVESLMPKVGRNEPCPCGSGKKYKKCCGRGL